MDWLNFDSGPCPQWERLERIGAWERVVAWAQANQLREMAIFAHGAEKEAVRHAEERAAARVSGKLVAPAIAHHIDALESAAAEISLMLQVSFWELPDGMAMVSVCLPAGEAVGVYGVLDEYARATGGAGDDRSLPARRADALVDLVCGSAGYLSTGTRTHETPMPRSKRRRARRRRSRVRVQVRVTVPSAPCSGSTNNLVSSPVMARSPPSRPGNWLRKARGGESSPIPPAAHPSTTEPLSTDHRPRSATWL